jgi:hypothetical protein
VYGLIDKLQKMHDNYVLLKNLVLELISSIESNSNNDNNNNYKNNNNNNNNNIETNGKFIGLKIEPFVHHIQSIIDFVDFKKISEESLLKLNLLLLFMLCVIFLYVIFSLSF